MGFHSLGFEDQFAKIRTNRSKLRQSLRLLLYRKYRRATDHFADYLLKAAVSLQHVRIHSNGPNNEPSEM